MAEFPKKAKVVIVGLGGIVGASIAHHLIERGWDDIVGIDKSGIPTDIGSTAHASDFCYTTSHDFLSCWTTLYSIDFFEKMGHYARIGGIEVARVGDDARMDEIKRKVASAKAFGTRARLIEPAEIKQKIRTHGIRNSHLLSIAPTGTISLAFADNASNGIEPPFSWTYQRRKRMADGTWADGLLMELLADDLID